jgi:malto-oligosyltrehalose trehalohydrolase
VHLVVENEHNDPAWLRRTDDLSAGLYNAQWNDDFHHVLAVSLDGSKSSYFRDYGGHPDWLGRVLASGFAYQGETLPSRGEPKGGPSADLPPTAFISYIQNHDQVGNRLFGERIAHLSSPAKLRAAAALYLLSPQIPMILMGEEWGTEVPFLFFSDVDPALGDAIREDRVKTFGQHIAAENRGKPAPDPMAEATFQASKLDWAATAAAPGAEILSLYRALIRVRREEIVPRLGGMGGHAGEHELVGDRATLVRWHMDDTSTLVLLANLSDDPVPGVERPPGRTLWLEGTADDATLGPWTVLWTLTEAAAP